MGMIKYCTSLDFAHAIYFFQLNFFYEVVIFFRATGHRAFVEVSGVSIALALGLLEKLRQSSGFYFNFRRFSSPGSGGGGGCSGCSGFSGGGFRGGGGLIDVAEPSALECFLQNPPEVLSFDQCYITRAVDVVVRYKKKLEADFFGLQ